MRYPASEFDLSIATFPADGERDKKAYLGALAALPKGSLVTVFTPDDTHFTIAMDCIAHGMHVLVTKPVCMKIAEHAALHTAAREQNVLVAVEVHKRWDPIYQDARDRIRSLGDFSYLSAYMSQPKRQLKTFASWAGASSDISFYLNSHHVDFSEWCLQGIARPVQVSAVAATGVGSAMLGRAMEDTITLTVQWENLATGNLGIGVYTASWIAPPSDVHSQQRFFVMCHGGEVTVDQAHRGYTCATDDGPFSSVNPLFWKSTPSDGKFAGQGGYGYRSIEAFVRAVKAIQEGKATPSDFDDGSIATVGTTFQTTAVLEAGKHSLDDGGRPFRIVYAGARDGDASKASRPVRIEPAF
jgi:D-galacturonate reductase